MVSIKPIRYLNPSSLSNDIPLQFHDNLSNQPTRLIPSRDRQTNTKIFIRLSFRESCVQTNFPHFEDIYIYIRERDFRFGRVGRNVYEFPWTGRCISHTPRNFFPGRDINAALIVAAPESRCCVIYGGERKEEKGRDREARVAVFPRDEREGRQV